MTDREKQILITYFDEMIKGCDEKISSWTETKTLCIKTSKNLKLGLKNVSNKKTIKFVDLRDEPMTDNYSYAICKCHTAFYAIRLPKNFSGRFNCPNCGEELGYYG